MNKPKISIVCITYNHEKYIKQAIESFLKQKTNFIYEILIGDDASNDNTTKIIKKFENDYPNIIKAIYRKKNIGFVNNLKDLLSKAQGDYISLCEGDDFFINSNKIQMQVDFLDEKPECSLCFHPVKVFFENNEKEESVYPDSGINFNFTLSELIRWNFIQTNSVVYRNQNNYAKIPSNIIPADWYLHLYHARVGEIGYINKTMSAYRKHPKGLWWNYTKNMHKTLIKYGIGQLNTYFEINKLFEDKLKYKKINLAKIDYIFKNFIEIDKKYSTNLLSQCLKKFSKEFSEYFIMLEDKPEKEIFIPNESLQNQLQLLEEITDSKFYKIWPIYTKIKKMFFKLIHKF